MTRTNPTERPMYLVIPCGADKLDRPAAARDLYTSTMFRLALDAATAEVEAYEDGEATILVLSALHGLVTLDTLLDPYDVRMGDPGSVTVERLAAQAAAHGIVWDDDTETSPDVYALLPASYFAKLDEALRLDYIYPTPVYEACSGIGDQRHVCAVVRDM